MDAASIEEVNRMRATLGLKPLPVPGQAPQQDAIPSAESDEDAPSTLETRQAKAYDNFQKQQEAEAAKVKRKEKATAVKKARDAAQRFTQLEGKGFGAEEDDVDAKAWLMGQKKRHKNIQKSIKTEQELAVAKAKADAEREYGAKDLAGVKVAHNLSSFLEGDEQVLTLKDSTIQENEDEGDELEAVAVREKEALTELLDLKKKKPAYNPYEMYEDGEASILGQYDDEIDGKKKKLFTLDDKGTVPEIDDILAAPAPKKRGEAINIDNVLGAVPSSDYMDIKVKKPKKKKGKATRQRQADEDDMLLPEEPAAPTEGEMDIDSGAGARKKRKVTEDIIDDEDLQASLAIQRKKALKKRKKTRPEDIARQLQQDVVVTDSNKDEEAQGGLVIDDISEFVTSLKKPEEEEDKPKKAKPRNDESVTAMDLDSDHEGPLVKRASIEEEHGRDISTPANISTIGVEQEKTVSQGVGATLGLLKERGLVKETKAVELNEHFRSHQLFLAEKRRRIDEFEEEARRQREKDRTSGKLDRMSQREREEHARQQNTYRDQQTARIMNDLYRNGYRPRVELKYTDEHGRNLNEKEAFKQLSHQFHGKGSGKGKTDKMLKRVEDEKRRESQSMLDASQNVGMSSATAQQLKKRKEAGVRLA